MPEPVSGIPAQNPRVAEPVGGNGRRTPRFAEPVDGRPGGATAPQCSTGSAASHPLPTTHRSTVTLERDRRAAREWVLRSQEADMSQPAQQQSVPGTDRAMDPTPDYGEDSYRALRPTRGQGALHHRRRQRHRKAVASPSPARGPTSRSPYLKRARDAEQARRFDRRRRPSRRPPPGRRLRPAALPRPRRPHGGAPRQLDDLVITAAFQMSHDTLEEYRRQRVGPHLATNVSAYFHTVKGRSACTLTEGRRSIASSSSTPTYAVAAAAPLRRDEGRDRQHEPPLSPSCSASAASGRTAWSRDRCGHRSSRRRCPRRRSRASRRAGSARTPRANPPSSHRCTSCSPQTRPSYVSAPRRR